MERRSLRGFPPSRYIQDEGFEQPSNVRFGVSPYSVEHWVSRLGDNLQDHDWVPTPSWDGQDSLVAGWTCSACGAHLLVHQDLPNVPRCMGYVPMQRYSWLSCACGRGASIVCSIHGVSQGP